MELVRVLAAGGFGIVYLARDHWLDRDVAVKEFLPIHLAGRGNDLQVELRTGASADTFAQGLRAFIAEAKLLAHFSHPAIVKVHRFWEANGTGYMVMPYLRGPTLGQVRRSMSEPPTEEWLRSIMDPLMGALAMLHAEGVYHRDIAPDNVLVGDNGVPVLLDFGAARSIGCTQSRSPTAILKPHFAPIEQYAEATHLRQGPWTDIYSLGALIAYLLDGTPPPAATARSIEDEMKPLQERHIAAVSSTFLSAIDWALSVRPQDRPQDIAELRDALDARTFPATIQLDRPSRPPKQHQRAARPLQIALVGVALAAAAISLAPGSLSDPPARELVRQSVREPVREPVHEAVRERVREPVREPDLQLVPEPVAAHARDKPTPQVAAAVPSTILTATASTLTSPAQPAKKSAKRGSRRAVASYAATATSQCSGRGFFLRTYCMQRACKEPRFRSDVQCVSFQSQTEARLSHY